MREDLQPFVRKTQKSLRDETETFSIVFYSGGGRKHGARKYAATLAIAVIFASRILAISVRRHEQIHRCDHAHDLNETAGRGQGRIIRSDRSDTALDARSRFDSVRHDRILRNIEDYVPGYRNASLPGAYRARRVRKSYRDGHGGIERNARSSARYRPNDKIAYYGCTTAYHSHKRVRRSKSCGNSAKRDGKFDVRVPRDTAVENPFRLYTRSLVKSAKRISAHSSCRFTIARHNKNLPFSVYCIIRSGGFVCDLFF